MRLAVRVPRALPDTLFARIAMVLVINLASVWAVALLLVELENRLGPMAVPYLANQIANNVQMLDSVAPSERSSVAHAVSGPDYVVWTIKTGDSEPALVAADPDDGLVSGLTERLRGQLARHGAPARVWPFEEPGAIPRDKTSARTVRIAVGLTDGGLAAFRIRLTSPSLRWYPIIGLAVAVCLIVSTMSLVFARGFSRRLAEFANAAESFGRAGEGAVLAETGPREIKLATRAFNQMQERLRRFIRDRTQMLAAISHDLRTPLTRLRLRAEFIDDAQQRKKVLADIAEMEAMIAETLAFARDDLSREQRRPERLDTLLDELCRQIRDAGHEVELTEAAPATVELSAVAMRRALGNLIDNAVKYGRRARVALAEAPGEVAVTVDDDGPGIPEAMQEFVFRPFQRLEGSRNRDTGGVGLGLTVARTIVRGHGGDITIENRPEGGLRATVTLPA